MLGGPTESKLISRIMEAENARIGIGQVLYSGFWEYISNSEAVSLAWVIKRSCTEAKGAPLVMIAIQHDDLGGQPELGDRLCDSHMVEEFLDDAVSRRFGVDNPWRRPKHTTELHNVPNSPEVPELSDRADLPEASDLL